MFARCTGRRSGQRRLRASGARRRAAASRTPDRPLGPGRIVGRPLWSSVIAFWRTIVGRHLVRERCVRIARAIGHRAAQIAEERRPGDRWPPLHRQELAEVAEHIERAVGVVEPGRRGVIRGRQAELDAGLGQPDLECLCSDRLDLLEGCCQAVLAAVSSPAMFWWSPPGCQGRRCRSRSRRRVSPLSPSPGRPPSGSRGRRRRPRARRRR